MARVVQVKKTADKIAVPSDNDVGLLSFALMKLDNSNKIVPELDRAAFLLNPSTYTETKTTNWNAQEIPGQSDPVYQWVAGGPRQVSFEALVTEDSIHFGIAESSFASQAANAGLNAVGNLASQLAGVKLPPLADLFSAPGAATELSIADKLNYYRSLLYPEYKDKYEGLQQSPPLVVMAAGRTFSKSGKSSGQVSGAGGPNSEYLPVWVVTSLSIKITKQLPNLDPMEAMVSFVLQEYPIKPISASNFLPVNKTAGDASIFNSNLPSGTNFGFA